MARGQGTSESGMRLSPRLTHARNFAILRHTGQKYGEHDYIYHLDMAVQIGVEESLPEDYLIAVYLHDTLEDTKTTRKELAKEFGEEIADGVWRVTDEPGQNRRERAKLTHPKIAGHEMATHVKLCDRIANTQSSKSDGSGLWKMYRKEWPTFRAGIYQEGIAEKMWARLEDLMQD